MRNIKDVLRLKYVGKLSHERIAVALGVSKGVVTKYAGLAWPVPQALTGSWTSPWTRPNSTTG